MEQWVEKCMQCAHSYYRQDDAETLYCRCRNGCNFKEAEMHIYIDDISKMAEKLKERLTKLIDDAEQI